MQKSNLLVVDDSPYIHKMVRACMEPDPVIVHSAYDGEQALQYAPDLKPNLILMDVDMPRMDGIEACRRLKAGPTTTQTPIIFFSSDSSLNDKVKALDMGAVDYITKPVKPEELQARVRAALRARKRVEQTSMIDMLSGLWNEAYLNLNLPVQISHAQRTHQPLSCTMAEIDQYTQIQTAHGREVAERIVKSVADIFVSQSRMEDVLAHLWRGRFVVLHPCTARTGAAHLADRIRGEIERGLFYFDQIQVGVTSSFGVCDLETPVEGSLLKSAEHWLARAKQSGGNTVVIASATNHKKIPHGHDSFTVEPDVGI
ncbi:MAG TPA: response regulator [Tepidisphaeraceae bacterium]|jgi:diguanylate cyclase (GGDEF)-like protein